MYSVVIVGGGVAGASIAYHLCSIPDFKEKILLIESGEIGKGIDKNLEIKDNENVVETSLGEENQYKPWLSGSNVFDDPNRIKMIVTSFASTANEFYRHHGLKGLSLYNKIASLGRDKQIDLAKLFLNNDKLNELNKIPDNYGCIQLGSLMVCEENEVSELKSEYELYKKSGFEVEWWDKEKVQKVHGNEAKFHAGLFFPKDGIVDSRNYSKKLIEYCKSKGLEVKESTSMKNFEEDNQKIGVTITLNNNQIISTKNLILATGAYYSNDHIQGIIRPCYSYLTAIKNLKTNKSQNLLSENFINSHNTSNFFTYGFSHDWAMCKGFLRISGEDHFSALKHPRMNVRCKILEDWCYEKYPGFNSLSKKENNLYNLGVYSETPDFIPILGKINDQSNVIYLMGCNAWGQAILSGAATLIPGMLGLKKLNREEEEYVRFLSIRRFRTLNAKPKF